MGAYQLESKCYGCKAKEELRQVTVNEHDYTLCHTCEQIIISAMLQGKI